MDILVAALIVVIVIWLVATIIVDVANLAAHISRYTHYRRSYPAIARGRVWRHTRDHS
jgi:uncharacterized protein HemY